MIGNGPGRPIGLRRFSYPRSVAVAAWLVPVVMPSAFAAGAIVDQQSCLAELAGAEEMIVRADIDSTTFRGLSDQLAEMRALCEADDYAGAQTKLRNVINALGDPGSKS